MNIAVIGLGLIGGSFCKTIKRYTKHLCMGYDLYPEVTEQALKEGAIDRDISPQELQQADFIIVSLHPTQTVSFLQEHAKYIAPGTIVIDTCGVKESILDGVEAHLCEHRIKFVGCHPMAGREFSGFSYALDNLFDHASFIITPTAQTDPVAVEQVQAFAQELHFAKVVLSTPDEHDRVIAFTSQLAHVVSNAYVKSPILGYQSGFSAGSFLDLTRVAKLNESMWTELFLMNRPSLLIELENLIRHLNEYQQALEKNDRERLKTLLRDGRILKEESLKRDQ
ncbi:Arogenate dehydrogenase [uncultured Ruminococcus sp.]|nr:Arogenate dehydrogenase [uncultured Ruminococcus sp.]SCH32034.1 Arogenate dehydrogenase [uncultured Clostridium sp.]